MTLRRRLAVPCLVGSALSALGGTAWAQTPKLEEFSIQRFEPAPGPNNFLGVETLSMEGKWQWSAAVFVNYSRDPFLVQSCTTPTTCGSPSATAIRDTHVVSDMVTTDLLASVAPTPWLQLGLRLPLSYVAGQGLDLTTGGPLASSLHAFGVGDPYVEGKARVFGSAGGPLVLGIGGDLSVGVQQSNATNFIGDASPVTGGVRGIFDGQIGSFFYGANLRAVVRKDVTVGINQNAPNTTVGPEMRYGAAAGVRLSPVVDVLAEAFGGTGFRPQPGTNVFEVDGAFRFRPLNTSFAITVGGGAGIGHGVGAPAGRVFAGLGYAPVERDTDGDGIPDNIDKCPTIPEDFDGFEDEDGCPEPDNDGDGIPDKLDRCPNTRATPNGAHDGDGCPHELADRDHDGIPDDEDKCPDAGGPDVIRNPRNQYYGCPDRDHDGIPDYLDKCPDVPEPTDDLWDGSGCPHVRDSDGDGIPDDVDKCPNEPETYNGFEDEDGCPDVGPTTVEIKNGMIQLTDRVEFATGSDKIQGKKSFQVLDAVVGVMNGHKEVSLVEIQGHTDNAGVADQNRKLSTRRAEAVVKYLVSKGIDPKRLTATGFGPDKPLADNKTAIGRQKNRRVELHIIDNTKKPDAATSVPSAPPSAPLPPSAPPTTPTSAPPPASAPQ
jgi:outer membrane protein OmpA-like peptidoglycan-associated protein